MKNSHINANMWQKSLIQQIMERNTTINEFKRILERLTESYTVKNNTFGIIHGAISEINNGYFVVEKECDDLESSIKEMNGDLNKCIRIIENQKYQVGSWYKTILECPQEHTVFDIENQIQFDR